MTGELLAPQLHDYLDALVPPRPPELEAMEEEAARTRFPIVGPAAGHLCYLLTRMLGARRVFEMGSGFGYSTAWFARAVQENGGGKVFHVVWDEELSKRAKVHLRALGLDALIEYRVGEAVDVLRTTDGSFDVIFNDINKEGYPASLPVIASKLRSGGLLIVDNMLWHARIFDKADRSEATEGVRQFTKAIIADPRWISTVIPIRDGLLLAWRKPST